MSSARKTPRRAERSNRLVDVFLEEARRIVASYRDADDADHADHANGGCGTGDVLVSRLDDGQQVSERVRTLVEPHLFYVVQMANSLRSREVPFEDLLAAGNMGLVEAAHRFDPGKKVKFLTYASWWIRKRMLDLLAREGRSIHLTRYAREKRRRIERVRAGLRQKLRREPEPEEVAESAGVDVDDIVRDGRQHLVVLSIERDSDSISGTTAEQHLIDDRLPDPEQETARREMLAEMERELARLSSRQRALIAGRFGLDGSGVHTFQQLGEKLGLSRERARQIETDALRRLRRRLAARNSAPPPSPTEPAARTPPPAR